MSASHFVPPTPMKSKVKFGIGFKLTLIVSILLFLAFVGQGIYDSVCNYNETIEQKTQIITEENRLLSKEFLSVISNAYQTSVDMMSIVEYELSLPKDMRSRERIETSITKLLERSKVISGLGVFFEPNAFDGKDDELSGKESNTSIRGRFIPYAEKNGSSCNSSQKLPKSFNTSVNYLCRIFSLVC